MELNTKQWRLIEKHLSRPRRSPGQPGRPRGRDKIIFEGVLWMLRNGTSWRSLPVVYGSRATVHRRFQEWSRNGSLRKVWAVLLQLLDDKSVLDWSQAFIDGSFVEAKRGALALEKRAVAKALGGSLLPKETEGSPSRSAHSAPVLERFDLRNRRWTRLRTGRNPNVSLETKRTTRRSTENIFVPGTRAN